MTKKLKTPTKGARMDYLALVCVLVLVSIGLVMVYSASYVTADYRTLSSYTFIKKEIFFVIAGFLAMFFTANIVPYNWFKKKRAGLTWALVVVSIGLLLLLKVPGFGKEVNGALRWLEFGSFSFQPSELAKYACIFLLAMQITTKGLNVKRFLDLLIMSIFPVLCILLILTQPDFSTSLIIVVITFYLFFVSGMKWNVVAGASLGIVALGALLIKLEPYRLSRLMTLFNPLLDPLGSGYQVLQSLYAISSGGLTGVGLGNSTQKMLYLPEPHNDYIFSIIAEELGFVGAFFVILVFVVLIIRFFKIAANAPDRYSGLLVSGITIMIAVQFLINIGVAVSLFPSTGIALPFISYGGTSLVLLLAGVGVVLNISRYDSKYLVTKDDEKYQEITKKERYE